MVGGVNQTVIVANPTWGDSPELKTTLQLLGKLPSNYHASYFRNACWQRGTPREVANMVATGFAVRIDKDWSFGAELDFMGVAMAGGANNLAAFNEKLSALKLP